MDKSTLLKKGFVEIPDCISIPQQNMLEKYTLDSSFPWNFDSKVVQVNNYNKNYVLEKGTNPPQFTHYVHLNQNSNVIFFAPVLNFLSSFFNINIQIFKCKFNFLYKNISQEHHYPHVDLDITDDTFYSCVYYVNNTDGDTFLFNETAPAVLKDVTILKTVKPKKGLGLIFNSNRFHSSSSPLLNDYRIVLNIVFKLSEN